MKKIKTVTATSPNIGEMLKAYIKNNRINQAPLSRLLGISISSLLRYQKTANMQIKTLWKLSNALKYNFFMDIALLLPKEYGNNTNLFEEKDKKIQELEDKIRILETEKAILLQINKQKA